MTTLFVDCSYLRDHAYLNTGIQRVVRSFLEQTEFLETKHGIKVIPVSISHGAFDVLDTADLYDKGPQDSPSVTKPSIKLRLHIYFENVYRTGRVFLDALFGNNERISKFLFAPRSTFGLGFIVDKIILDPLRFITGRKRKKKSISEESDPFSMINQDDILLLLDSTWYSDIWPSVKKFKEHGNKVVAVIYDLIPITHPQFCDDYLAEVFKKWFMASEGYVDGYIAISKTVRDDLKKFMDDCLPNKIDRDKFDYFYLGADFKHRDIEGQDIRVDLKNEYQKRPTYFIVSTIEPRKNHAYLLDAFDKLWEKGVDVNLFFVGRIGWKVDSFMARMQKHKQYNKRLFHWQNINDNELEYCYSHAKALLFPSFVEGFGLPIIESLEKKLPVIAGDTPIHREIGGDNIGYCDISNPEDLMNIIEDIEENGFGNVPMVDEQYRWLSWAESSDMLYEKIRKMG
ncbi:MAG: glycosyltransferase family 4 protein [Desulfobulbaceae bacterium]|nr:glycosyltransferase family 4 protein [Desulfobulbaceae bacterium]